MKKGLIEMVFILDRSGSMGGLEKDTIGGYNGLIKKQQGEEGEAILSTILFDDKIEVLHDRLSLDKVPEMTDKEYYVRGCTALLDALGGAISHIKKVQKEMDKAERPEKTLFVVTTDGMENASVNYTYDKVKKMVEKNKKKGWEFLFLGANMDAISVASHMGIDAGHTVNFNNDEIGTALNYECLEMAVKSARENTAMLEAVAPGWKGAIEDDFKSRKAK